MPEGPEIITTPVHFSGKHISSTGALRVLVVFIRFSDDNATSTVWPDPATLPAWAQNFVNPSFSSSGNYYPGCVSQYFYQNSYGNFHIIGDIYYITTDFSEQYYHQFGTGSQYGIDPARAMIEMEVLNKLDNQFNVNFALYDNWNRAGEYSITSGPDGEVDMIWFITKNITVGNFPPGQARFDIGRATLDCSTHVRDGKTISGSNSFPGSGISMFEPHMYRPVNASTEPFGPYPIVNHVAHEMTHYFFGYGHFADEPHYITNRRYSSSIKNYAGGWRSVYSG